MRALWTAIALLGVASAFAFDKDQWIADLDTTRADLLTQARVTITEGESAEDTEDDFASGATAISVTGTTVTLGYFRDLGDEFQVCVDVNGNTTNGYAMHSCFDYTRSEIEK